MKMKKVSLLVKGIAPLLMHNIQGANPLGKVAQVMKPKTSKRNKTDVDYAEIARLEWEAGLYLYNGEVVMPAKNVEKCLILGARKTKNGKQFESSVFVEKDFMPLKYSGNKIKVSQNGEFPNPEFNQYFEEHRDIDMVRVGKNTVPRCRPIFHNWSFELILMYDDSVIDKRTIIDCVQDAGRLIGLCDRRPRNGRFEVELIK